MPAEIAHLCVRTVSSSLQIVNTQRQASRSQASHDWNQTHTKEFAISHLKQGKTAFYVRPALHLETRKGGRGSSMFSLQMDPVAPFYHLIPRV